MKTIYFASRTIHAAKWREYRDAGVKVISTWINEAGQGESLNLPDLACRCIWEPTEADFTILYGEGGDYLKYALCEVGAALAAGKRVLVVNHGSPSISNTMLMHPNVEIAYSLEKALKVAGYEQ